MALDEEFNHQTVLEEARQVLQVNIPELAVLYQGYKEPKCESLRAVKQELGHDEVHPLHIVHLIIVLTEGYQNALQLGMAFASHTCRKIWMTWKCSVEIPIYLGNGFAISHHLGQWLVNVLQFLVLSHDVGVELVLCRADHVVPLLSVFTEHGELGVHRALATSATPLSTLRWDWLDMDI